MDKQLAHGVKIPKNEELSFCEGCVEGKMHRHPFKPVGEIRSSERLQLVHSDVCGPMHTESFSGQKYFVTFTDDYSRCCAVYFMKQKSEVLEKFKEFEAITTNESCRRVVKLRTDNGGEYVSREFEEYLKSRGIQHELTVPHSPEQNGVAERMNRTLTESARAMIAHAGLPNNYWAEAIATAAYIRNRTPTTAFENDTTPYERWYGKKPDVTNLRVFGCIAYAHVPDAQRRKLDKKANKLRFVGYSTISKGYRLLDEKTHKVFVRRDVVFNEIEFDKKRDEKVIIDESMDTLDVSSRSEEPSGSDGISRCPDVAADDNPRRSQRQRQPPLRYGVDEYVDVASEDQVCHSAYHVCQISEPQTIEEALKSDQAREWKSAADAEYESLMANDTWELVELPSGRKPIGCKWVFKVKHTSDGKVERFKGRLVAKGYAQKYGIDYEETFSPVVRFSSIRSLLAFAVQNDMLIHQMDVVSAFLHGNLSEEIYMEQPDGYVIAGKENLVCRLKKSLYGLKQSPRCWYSAFREYMELIEYKQSDADPCVYVRTDDLMTIVAVYVDDLILITETMKEMKMVKESLATRFKMTDMGKLHYCLGITIVQDESKKCLWLHQSQYIERVLEKYSLTEAKVASTPADPSVRLEKDDGVSAEVDPILYQSMVGSLLYAACATRPDIAQAVGAVAKFCSKPTEAHLTAVKRILKYLKGSASLALKYQKLEANPLIGYCDADWAGDRDDRHSTSGTIFLMAGGPISWFSKKQAIVALSTSEAEYVALCAATQEAVWLRRLLADLKVTTSGPTLLMEDNQGAIAISKNPTVHARTKHIDIRYHYVREAVQDGIIDLRYCPTDQMIADLMTKPLPRRLFENLRLAMGMEAL